MKANWKLFMGIVVGVAVMGVLVAYFQPVLAVNVSFLLGFVAGLVCISLVFVLILRRYQVPYLKGSPGNGPVRNASDSSTTTNVYTWLLVSGFIILGGVVAGFLIFNQSEMVKMQAQHQKTLKMQQSELIESVRIRSMVFLMSNVLDKADEELNNDDERKLSDEIIDRIAALSYSFKPYTCFVGDSLLERKLSPERGQLLIALSKMHIDTGSLDRIMARTTFAAADLRMADLRRAYLRGIDLKGADLQGANLQGVDLHKADLSASNLWGVNFSESDLVGANFKRADLRWAVLNDAHLNGAQLDGATMTSAIMRRADLSGAVVKWADMSGVFLDQANMDGTNLTGTSLARAHLRQANLSNAILILTDLSEADLSQAKLNNADLTRAELSGATLSEKNWLGNLTVWSVKGAENMIDSYRIVEDKSDGQDQYRIVKNEKQ